MLGQTFEVDWAGTNSRTLLVLKLSMSLWNTSHFAAWVCIRRVALSPHLCTASLFGPGFKGGCPISHVGKPTGNLLKTLDLGVTKCFLNQSKLSLADPEI